MEPTELQFHLEEYRALKAEVKLVLRLLYEGSIWAVAASGAIIAWLLSHPLVAGPGAPGSAKWFAFAPIGISGLIALMLWQLNFSIGGYAGYIGRLEERLQAEGLGWQRSPEVDRNNRTAMYCFLLIWFILLLADGLFGVWAFHVA